MASGRQALGVMVRPAPGPARPPVGLPLTDREREVLDLVSRPGGSRKAAAHELGVTVFAIDHRLRAIFRKLDVDSVAAAARLLGQAEQRRANAHLPGDL